MLLGELIMMLKCGEKNNSNYTFGLAQQPIKEAKKIKKVAGSFCSACGTKLSAKASYCSKCGSPV
jgi:uncharacterized OB-fold protein